MTTAVTSEVQYEVVCSIAQCQIQKYRDSEVSDGSDTCTRGVCVAEATFEGVHPSSCQATARAKRCKLVKSDTLTLSVLCDRHLLRSPQTGQEVSVNCHLPVVSPQVHHGRFSLDHFRDRQTPEC